MGDVVCVQGKGVDVSGEVGEDVLEDVCLEFEGEVEEGTCLVDCWLGGESGG